jgi:hypothetical protein
MIPGLFFFKAVGAVLRLNVAGSQNILRQGIDFNLRLPAMPQRMTNCTVCARFCSIRISRPAKISAVC